MRTKRQPGRVAPGDSSAKGRRESTCWVESRSDSSELCAISTLSTGKDSIFPFARLEKAWQVQVVIGTEVPASPEGRQRQEGAAGNGRTDLHRMAMRRASAQVGPPEEAPEELALPLAVRGSPWGASDAEVPTQEGPQKVSEPASGQDQKLEATPELVSQDRVAEGLRVVRLANTGRS